MFTDRFIAVPTQIYNIKEYELTEVKNFTDVETYINPLEICLFEPCAGDEDNPDNLDATEVIMKNGKSFIVYLSVKKFIKLLNSRG
ncbi:MAG TPA: hypothetical protein VD794_07040 [Flavisolibacter sp.]|nr:hypothetical protein [Flavisolibacter sp.]